MNNLEWAYLENAPLIGTIHFIAPGIDEGDIIYKQELHKENRPTDINQIRQKAFDQVYELFPRTLRRMQEGNFKPVKQTKKRTTRYIMLPFLRRILQEKLKRQT